MSLTNKRSTAFTLAEVLITLAIIGVVAALTIPNLLKNNQNAENIVAAKKAFSIVSQAYATATSENGGGFGIYNTDWNTQSMDKFNAIKAQLKVIKDCPYNSNAQGNCWSNSGVGMKNYAVSGCSQTSNNGNQFINNSFTTADGMFWMLYSGSITTGIDWLYIDVNGNRGPNDWGKDVFIFKLDDMTIAPVNSNTCLCVLKHNDGSVVDITTEFSVIVK